MNDTGMRIKAVLTAALVLLLAGTPALALDEEKAKAPESGGAVEAPEPAAAEGEPAPGEDVLDIRAEDDDGEVTWYWDEEGNIVRVTGKGGTVVRFRGLTLRADQVDYDTRKGILQGRGAVVVSDDATGDEYRAEEFVYDLDDPDQTIPFPERSVPNGGRDPEHVVPRTAEFEGQIGLWSVGGRDLEQVSEEEYVVQDGVFTTCSLVPPHYRFTARRLRIFPGKRIIAYGVVLRIRNVPVMYIPVFRRSLQKVPQGLVVYPYYQDGKGASVLAHYNWYRSPRLRGRLYLDYFSELGFGEGLDVNYQFTDRRSDGRGYLYGYYIDEEESPRDDVEAAERWKVHYRHRQDHILRPAPRLPGGQAPLMAAAGEEQERSLWRETWENTRLIMRLDNQSDAEFNDDYLDEELMRFGDRSQLEDQQPDGSISLSTVGSRGNVTLFARKRVDDFQTVTEELPRLSAELNESPFGEWGRSTFYYALDSSLTHYNEAPEGEEAEEGQLELSLSGSVPYGWMRFKPEVRVESLWYSMDAVGRTGEVQSNLEAKLGLRTAAGIWRVYDTPGRSTVKMKHTIDPRVTYRYAPEPTEKRDELFSFFDRVPEERDRLEFALIDRLEGKTADGAIRRISEFTLETRYDFLKEELGEEPWSGINADLLMWPREDIQFRTEARYDIEDGIFESIDTDLGFERDQWVASIGARFYEPGGEKDTFDLHARLRAPLGPKWLVDIKARYDANTGDFKEERLTLYRDLHCWEMQLGLQERERGGTERELTAVIAFRIKGVGGPRVPLSLY